jgi:hypothetical protein
MEMKLLENMLYLTSITDLKMVKNHWRGRPIMSMNDVNVVKLHMITSYQCVMMTETIANNLVPDSQTKCHYQNIC